MCLAKIKNPAITSKFCDCNYIIYNENTLKINEEIDYLDQHSITSLYAC